MMRELILTRLRDLVADQHDREVHWTGMVQTKVPDDITSLSDPDLLNLYEQFYWLKVSRESEPSA